MSGRERLTRLFCGDKLCFSMNLTIQDDINRAIETLAKGGLILYPTDTIWGIGCDATRPEAVKRVFDLKRRADSKALIVLLDSADKLDHYVVDVPEMALELIEVAVNPLTIIYEGAYNVAPALLGDNDSLGVRIPQDDFTQQLCARFGKPIVSTSANISGEPSPATFADISKEIIEGVDYVVSHRQDDATPRKASNIIRLNSNGTFKIIR